MALQFTRTDANTGHAWTVYARIDDGTVLLLNNNTTIILNLYDSISAAQSGFNPVMPPDKVSLTPDEMSSGNATFVQSLAASAQGGLIQSPRDALLASMYFLLKQRPTYSSALDV